jgi:hypothetical protein
MTEYHHYFIAHCVPPSMLDMTPLNWLWLGLRSRENGHKIHLKNCVLVSEPELHTRLK